MVIRSAAFKTAKKVTKGTVKDLGSRKVRRARAAAAKKRETESRVVKKIKPRPPTFTAQTPKQIGAAKKAKVKAKKAAKRAAAEAARLKLAYPKSPMRVMEAEARIGPGLAGTPKKVMDSLRAQRKLKQKIDKQNRLSDKGEQFMFHRVWEPGHRSGNAPWLQNPSSINAWLRTYPSLGGYERNMIGVPKNVPLRLTPFFKQKQPTEIAAKKVINKNKGLINFGLDESIIAAKDDTPSENLSRMLRLREQQRKLAKKTKRS